MFTLRHLSLTFLVLWLKHNSWSNSHSSLYCEAWVVVPTSRTCSSAAFQQKQLHRPVHFSTKTDNDEKETSSESTNTSKSQISGSTATTEKPEKETDEKKITAPQGEKEEEEDDDDDEYEYIEYETLKEEDYLGSEWLVGTCWDSNTNKIKETWVRLAAKDDKNIAIWGDNSEGTWSLDVASQFLAISKEFLWGKQIWAGVVDDYYFVQGTVRGWTYISPASVLGQWQARRLGVDPEEAGTPPWFEVSEEDDEADEEKSEETSSKD